MHCTTALLSSAQVLEQAIDVVPTSEYNLYFHFDDPDLDVFYHNNARTLGNLYQSIENMVKVDSVCVYAYASPEGGSVRNDELSSQRASAVREYLNLYLPDLPQTRSSRVSAYGMSENWEGFIEMVAKQYRRHDKPAVLSILANEYITDETKKHRLNSLDGGYTWVYFKRIFMPELAMARVCVFGEAREGTETSDVLMIPGSKVVIRDTTYIVMEAMAPADTVVTPPAVAPSPVEAPLMSSQKTVLGLKTNLLLDAVTAVNFAIEVPFNKHFSLEYFQTTPWWRGRGNKFCMQFISFGGEARWWFLPRVKPATEKLRQRDALVGHFLGVYGWGGVGDIQLGRKFCYQFDFWSAGLTYGYSLPVSKHLNMEFTLSVGYARVPYQHYVPTEDFSLLIKDHSLAGTLHYIGPTKAEINLVIPIRSNTGRKAAKKGGDR